MEMVVGMASSFGTAEVVGKGSGRFPTFLTVCGVEMGCDWALKD